MSFLCGKCPNSFGSKEALELHQRNMHTATTEWWRDHANIIALGHYLVDIEGFDVNAILDFFEKPWHYVDEWNAHQQHEILTEATATQDRIERNLSDVNEQA